jgi:hypothetical protein
MEREAVIGSSPAYGIALIWVVLIMSSLHAQGVATARIAGTLTDPSGAALADAIVQAKHLETSSSGSKVTDSGGRCAMARRHRFSRPVRGRPHRAGELRTLRPRLVAKQQGSKGTIV